MGDPADQRSPLSVVEAFGDVVIRGHEIKQFASVTDHRLESQFTEFVDDIGRVLSRADPRDEILGNRTAGAEYVHQRADVEVTRLSDVTAAGQKHFAAFFNGVDSSSDDRCIVDAALIGACFRWIVGELKELHQDACADERGRHLGDVRPARFVLDVCSDNGDSDAGECGPVHKNVDEAAYVQPTCARGYERRAQHAGE